MCIKEIRQKFTKVYFIRCNLISKLVVHFYLLSKTPGSTLKGQSKFFAFRLDCFGEGILCV